MGVKADNSGKCLAVFAAYFRSLALPGIALGCLFLAASLTPGLIPRSTTVQGVLSGLCGAAGYGLAVGLRWIWRYLGLPEPKPGRMTRLTLFVACGAIVSVSVWQAVDWQNSIRAVMGMPPVDRAWPVAVMAIAVTVALLLLLMGRLIQLTVNCIAQRLDGLLPRRVSRLVAVALTATLLWSIGNGVLLRALLGAVDSSYRQFDALLEPEIARPDDPLKSGSVSSLVDWRALGRAGRAVVAARPKRADIAELAGVEALEPLRVYVGINSAESSDARARLALAELQRIRAFERSILVITTPTGTGWVDPASFSAVEYLAHGDIASVSVQYSYLPSWLALLIDPDNGADTARAVFTAVYSHWRTLPKAKRPRLYLHGLSLGALNSDLSSDLWDVIGDPFQGALWVGPPFQSRTWRQATSERAPTSPAWAPRFRDGAIIRFTTQSQTSSMPTPAWGSTRILYLQYPSDPITFFEPAAFYREPDWMRGPRAPDVSPDLRWHPVVTFLQLAVDMTTATSTPPGFGHVYSGSHYVDAWNAMIEPAGWSMERLDRLKAELTRVETPPDGS